MSAGTRMLYIQRRRELQASLDQLVPGGCFCLYTGQMWITGQIRSANTRKVALFIYRADMDYRPAKVSWYPEGVIVYV